MTVDDWKRLPYELPAPLEDVLVVVQDETGPMGIMAFMRKDGTWWMTGTDPLLQVEPLRWMKYPALPQDIS